MSETTAVLRRRKGSATGIDRSSVEAATRAIAEMLPDNTARAVVLDLLVRAVRAAHAASPGCWSITQFPRATRLNIGRLLVAEVLPDVLWLTVVDDAPGVSRLDPWRDEETPFVSLDRPHHFVALPANELVRFADVLRDAVQATVPAAAATASRSSYRGSWSPGVIGVMEQFAGADLPRPDWSVGQTVNAAPNAGAPMFDFLEVEVRRLSKALETPSVPAAVLARAREAFHERFGPDRLAEVQGRELLELMHGRSSRDSLSFWLEFKEDDVFPTSRFGSIRGGSALKYGVFQRAEDDTWWTGSARNMSELTVDEAIAFAERQRDELLAAHAVIDALPDDPTDPAWSALGARIAQAAPTSHQLAFFHKTLCLWEPEKIDDYNSIAFHGHILARLGVTPSGPHLYDAAAPLIALFQLLRETHPGLDPSQMSMGLNGLYGAPHGHWRVGTGGPDIDVWPAMRDGSWVGIGWEELGDLDDLIAGLDGATAQDALKMRLAALFPGDAPTTRGRSASQLWSFYGRMQEGDLVYAARGAQILGVGRVMGSYRFEAGTYGHRRDVRWLTTKPFQSPSHAGLRTTVHNLAPSFDIQAAAIRQVAGTMTQGPVSPASEKPRRIMGDIEQQLVRKGQVILYGPPGTGKTHHAIQAAQDISAHEVHGRPWAQLSQIEKRVIEGREGDGQRIWTCTFHPAFSYEDFVEGLRPIAKDGQLSFAPQPGLFRRICAQAIRAPEQHFVLIIDEFNRGDAPRIFGELLTLLELDKREKVSVVLPTSGESFSVPRNLFIIATMNTADRSIALLDAALRRRFGFMEFLPDATVLGDAMAAELRLADLLAVLNRRLLDTLGDAARNLQIGHAYLMGPKNVHTLRTAFQYDILPLLQEYCADDPELLERLLGAGLYDRPARQLRREPFASGQEDAFLAALTALDPALLQRREEPVAEDEDHGDDA